MKKVFLAIAIMIFAHTAQAHCQIPCGIFDDDLRFELIHEHITTIEKSVKEINELTSKKHVQDHNQLIRWVMNKEKHAQEIQDIVYEYFLAQRVKATPAKAHYHELLENFHKMIVLAMKTKQDGNPDKALKELHDTLVDTQKLYDKYRKALKAS